MTAAGPLANIADPIGALIAAVGAPAVDASDAARSLFGQDVFSRGAAPIAIFTPTDTAMLRAGLAAIAPFGLVLLPRGGGMSYTSGYLADRPGALVIDMAAMDRILAIDPVDMTVTVEAGCTWAALYAALKPLGFHTPAWGSLSGIKASVGGGMSQNGLFWGGGVSTMSPSCLSMEVVLADGTLVRTGSHVTRPFGPDVTGLFTSDCGAFAVKATVTLPLVREGTALAYGSFGFADTNGCFAAMSEVARAGLASECFGFDPFLQAQRMKRDSLTSDAKALATMMKAQGGFWKAMKAGARVVAAGRSFLDDSNFSVHFICEGRHQAAVDADLAAIRAICLENGAAEVENTIPKILRANPFPPVNSMVGPNGERWVPIHGVVAHSRAAATIAAITALFTTHEDAMDGLGVGAGYMFLTVGRTGFLIEPVFYWPDALDDLHRAAVEPAHLAKLHDFPANADARALVETLRQGVIDIFHDVGAAHFQVGRAYPLRAASDPAAWALLGAVKDRLDPDRRMNPGVLDL